MDHVVVTVKRANEARVRDILLPAHMPIAELADILARKLEWDRDADNREVVYDVVAEPPGRLLRKDETLAQAGAWDGSWLVFHPQGSVPEAAGQSESKSPVVRWSRLNSPLGAEPLPTPTRATEPPDGDVAPQVEAALQQNQPAAPIEQPRPRYVFKRIDDNP